MSERVVTQNFGNEKAKEIATYESLGGYQALRKAVKMSPDEIIAEVKKANLCGRGGAGFPAGVKWSFIPKDAQTVYMVINADEGEPGTFKDRWLMHWDPHRLIEGACIAAYAIRSHKIYIYIRGELIEGARLLDKAVAEAYDKGYLGASMAGSGWAMDFVVHRGAGAYICGEETALLNSLEGRRGWPRLKPPYPAIKGLFGQPTVVNNVETLMNVPSIIERGGQWFADLGVDGDGGTRCAAVSGHVKSPGVYEVPVGTNLRTILDQYAGGMRDTPVKGVIPGGSSFPVLTNEEIDVPWANSMMRNDKIRSVEVRPGQPFLWGGGKELKSGPGSGAIIVMDQSTDMVRACARIVKFYAHESCGQCTPCREGGHWVATIVQRIADGNGKPSDLEMISSAAGGIGGTTICALGDAVSWSVLGFLTKFRDEFIAKVSG
ncbi:MAG: NADH-quinone oxidoreductase subunit NuoF [Deltaproteobacteria bacterium]|nr:NADH-quinone oxidoreductase subunit NuoF [Deltaproteobacteria bacterium]